MAEADSWKAGLADRERAEAVTEAEIDAILVTLRRSMLAHRHVEIEMWREVTELPDDNSGIVKYVVGDTLSVSIKLSGAKS